MIIGKLTLPKETNSNNVLQIMLTGKLLFPKGQSFNSYSETEHFTHRSIKL